MNNQGLHYCDFHLPPHGDEHRPLFGLDLPPVEHDLLGLVHVEVHLVLRGGHECLPAAEPGDGESHAMLLR